MFNMKFMLINFFDSIPKNIKNSLYSSILEVCIVHPLDVYKTLYQQNHTYTFKNFIKTDFKFKYRGFLTRSTGIIPMRTTFWASQDFAEKNFKKYPLELFNYFLIGSFTSLTQTILDCPIENTKIQKINGNKVHYRQLFRGFQANYMRNLIFAGFVYGFNDYANKNDVNKFISGGLGGFLGSFVSQPIDYLKTLKQSGNFNYLDVIGSKHHYKSCYNGWIPRASMGFITMGVGSFVIGILNNLG